MLDIIGVISVVFIVSLFIGFCVDLLIYLIGVKLDISLPDELDYGPGVINILNLEYRSILLFQFVTHIGVVLVYMLPVLLIRKIYRSLPSIKLEYHGNPIVFHKKIKDFLISKPFRNK